MSTTAAPAITTDTAAGSTEAAIAAINTERNTLASVLATAIASVRNRTTVAADLTAARAQLATVTTERDTARTERDEARAERDTAVTAANAQRDTATAQLNAIAAFFGVKSEELAGKDAKAATELFAKKVTDATIEKVAGLGFPLEQLPKQTTPEGAAAKTLTKAEFNALNEGDKMKFATSGGRLTD
jgi:hypothetical protein